MSGNSVWFAGLRQHEYAPLAQKLEVDVAIIGGGITGMMAAYLLTQAGKSVALLEALRIGEGSTGHSTGNLYAVVGERHHKLGNEADEVIAARRSAVDLIERVIGECGIECMFARRPWFYFSEVDDGGSELEQARRIAQRAGLPLRDESPAGPFRARASVMLPAQAQFNPLWFVKGLADAVSRGGGRIFEHSKVTDIDPERMTLATENGSVRAAHVIMATHTPKGVQLIQSALAPYREYGVAAPIARDALVPGIYWTTQPHYSVRTHEVAGTTYVIVIGGSHKTGQEENTDAQYADVTRYAESRFGPLDIRYRWSAQNYQSADGLPYIGRSASSPDIYIATGFAADGLTYGALAARILSDRICGVQHPHAQLFASDRHRPLAAARDVVKENLNVAAQYLRDMPGGEGRRALQQLAPGTGEIVQIEDEKVAAFRDENGTLVTCSAVCTHMKCIVRWNSAERTWDCPCHGSRFRVDGTVIEGPAIADLSPVTLDDA